MALLQGYFLSRRYRPNKWPFYVLLGLEFPLTVALLALYGIAAPDTYRTKLWQDGYDNGFNSSPTTGLYAAANYRPYETPRVWSRFITNFNIVIAVLSMFFMLVKSIMYMLHVWPPVLSAIVHAIIVALYSVSVAWQSSNDTSDPDHPQTGLAWYITKNCNVAFDKSLVGYCQQAKASYACTITMLGVFCLYTLLSVWSCFPSKAHREEYAEKKRLQAEKYRGLEDGERDGSRFYPVPDTPGFQGGLNPMTPRTQAFNKLGGTKDLPLRNHFSTPNPTSPTFALRSPDLPRSPMSPGFIDKAGKEPMGKEVDIGPAREAPKLYFPPPPKSSKK